MTSAEDLEIMARISRVAGQINKKKNQQAGLVPGGPSHYHPYHQSSYSNRHRGGYAARGRPPSHRHRSLVLNGASPQPALRDDSSSASSSTANGSWVTKTDRHLQLINTSVYEKETQARTRAIEQTRRHKQVARDERERTKILHHLNQVNGPRATGVANNTGKHELEIQGIRFLVANNGSKLVKVPGDTNSPKATPKMATVGGVRFYRSKNGNLYRHGIVKAQRRSGAVKKVDVPCKIFSTTGIPLLSTNPRPRPSGWASVGLSPTNDHLGSCPKGPRCRYLHDPARVAVCTRFLQKEECFNGDACDLSHDLTPQRIPTCMHFLRDGCTKPNCRYAHNETSTAAPVCRAFGFYGYCEKGLECPDRHVAECPDFSNEGKCNTKGCKLPHRERASVLRNANDKAVAGADDVEDLSSDDDGESVDSYDVDSDEVDEFIGQDGAGDSSFVDQRDFIEL